MKNNHKTIYYDLSRSYCKKGMRWVEQNGRQVKSPISLQWETLNRLLKKAEKTAFGKHYDFGGIQTQDTYNATQRLTTYPVTSK